MKTWIIIEHDVSETKTTITHAPARVTRPHTYMGIYSEDEVSALSIEEILGCGAEPFAIKEAPSPGTQIYYFKLAVDQW